MERLNNSNLMKYKLNARTLIYLKEKHEGNSSWLNAIFSITIPGQDKNQYIQEHKKNDEKQYTKFQR